MIVFVENNTNFIIYGEIAKYLTQYHNVECCVLTLSLSKEKELNDNGIKAVFLGNIDNTKDVSFEDIITQIEKKSDSFTLAQYLNQDRHLRYYNYEKSYNILKEYTTKFYTFLLENRVELIIGELTWANELVFMYTANIFFKVPYVDLLNNYVFEKPRLTFFDDKHTTQYMSIFATSKANDKTSIDVESFIEKRYKTNINAIFNSFSNYSLFKYLEKYKLIKKYEDSFDYKYDFKIKLKFNIGKNANKLINSLFKSYLFDTVDLSCDYYYLPLHIQPEATPDVVAPFYNNQIELIEKISNALPIGTFLYVKDHPDGMGYRDVFYYKKIKSNNRVKLIDSNFKSSTLIENALSVITIAGTAGIEARLVNIPVITFSSIFFGNEIDHIYAVQNFNELPVLLKKFKYGKGQFKSKNIKDFLEFIHETSFGGYIYDPIIQPEVLLFENIEKIGKSIIHFLEVNKR